MHKIALTLPPIACNCNVKLCCRQCQTAITHIRQHCYKQVSYMCSCTQCCEVYVSNCLLLQVAGRMVKYSYYIARISSFIASKMQSSMSKNMVFPSCGDIKILQLLVCSSACHFAHGPHHPMLTLASCVFLAMSHIPAEVHKWQLGPVVSVLLCLM